MTNNGYWIAFLSETRDLPGKCLLVLSLDDGAISHKNQRYRKECYFFQISLFLLRLRHFGLLLQGEGTYPKKLEVNKVAMFGKAL